MKTYIDTTQRTTNEDISWTVAGTGYIESFNTNFPDTTFPSFSNINLLPESLVKSTDFEITLNDIRDADEIELTMHDGGFRIIMPYCKRLPATENTITINSEDLAELNGQVAITVSLIKNEYQVINNKRFKFERRFDVLKRIPVVE